jgi:hypothetical protein
MTKLLIFTSDEKNCDQPENGFNLFSCLNIQRPVTYPVYLSANKIVEDLNAAEVIIFPDEDIITNKDNWRNCYESLNELCQSNVSLLIVRHTNGWNYKEIKSTDDEDSKLKDYLCKQPDISASHVSRDFYCNELKAIAEAISKQDNQKYQQALETAKKRFGDPLLEAKLELLHACLTPEGLKTVIWGKDGEITITREGQEQFKGRIPDNKGKAEFEALKGKTDGPFGDQYIQALTRLRDALLPEHEYA